MIKFLDILKENNVLTPRNIKGRKEKHGQVTQKKIQQYIEDGSKGDLDLANTPITSLPDSLKIVGGDLDLSNTKITSLPRDLKVEGGLFLIGTPISKNYSKEEIRKMVPGVKGSISIG